MPISRWLLTSTALFFASAAASAAASAVAIATVNEELHAPQQRIVALSPHIVENLYAIGAGEHLVASVDHADYPAQAKALPRVGGYYGVQIEKILALNPTLVVVWQGGNKAADVETLTRLGVPLYISNIQGVEDIATELRQLGRLTGNVAQSERVAAQFEQRYERLQQDYRRTESPRPKVFYQLWSAPMMTVNNNTLIGKAITLCGGENAFADNSTDYPQISVENVALAKPDIIILSNEKSAAEQTLQWQQWQMIPAVKNKAIRAIDADLLHRYSTRVLDGITKLCLAINS
ncbi:cobalamin-binding protein [Pseudoalteromonas sp. T1lg48]|uniref:cobalamin-binding protein n=1 Tax=Pseudoalteromonas sp. T1lg48 TaxID=2077100 RepID=UPI000CF5E32D|nr:cobalamin-binding protein [Pseudoalteromonas sp. T1lg48]